MSGDGETRPDPVRVIRRRGERVDRPATLLTDDGRELVVEDRLPPDLPIGYHRLLAERGAQLLLVAPRRCAPPPPRSWGWAVQLPSLRSRASWGIGDLADLGDLSDWAAGLGAGFVLVSPTGAARPAAEPEASPYSPATRRFRSPLSLAIEELPGAARMGELLPELAAAGRALNASPLIARAAVQALKQRALEAIWGSGAATTADGEPGLAAYRAAAGPGLREWGLYLALCERHGPDWRGWPRRLRDRSRSALDEAARTLESRIAFHEWVQWLIDDQLARAASRLPLVADLPVGFARDGFDAWTWQSLLAEGVSLGAAPDPFNPAGQDWDLPPLAPDRLRAAGYAPLIETLRAAFRHAGALRIDHALGLFRQWWIPLGRPPINGAWTGFPADELLAVLAIESVRAAAPVVGEDLGTAAPGARQALARAGILSTALAYFEPRLGELPDLAMASVTTHDLPTLAGAWTGRDAAELRELGLTDVAAAGAAFRARLSRLTRLHPGRPARDAVLAGYRAIARSPARLAVAPLEDALLVEERPNVPGTSSALRANWSVSLPQTVEQLRRNRFARRLARAMAATRPPRPLSRGRG